MALFETILSI